MLLLILVLATPSLAQTSFPQIPDTAVIFNAESALCSPGDIPVLAVGYKDTRKLYIEFYLQQLLVIVIIVKDGEITDAFITRSKDNIVHYKMANMPDESVCDAVLKYLKTIGAKRA